MNKINLESIFFVKQTLVICGIQNFPKGHKNTKMLSDHPSHSTVRRKLFYFVN